MSVFTGRRLPATIFQVDEDRLPRGWYSDKYFVNIVDVLSGLSTAGYTFSGKTPIGMPPAVLHTGDIEVEMQIFTRRRPFSVIAGVDEALAILRAGAGYEDGPRFSKTFDHLQIEAVQDGVILPYGGDPYDVLPVMRIRGRYRDFAALETPILGVLTETTRVATNVYAVLEAAGGKDVLFFPARFAHYKLQALHGYAYQIAVEAFRQVHGRASGLFVSTDEQGAWWGGRGGGTIAHSAIACFLGDSAEAMEQFCRYTPAEIPRVALVDYHNDCIGDTLRVMERMYGLYREALAAGRADEAERFRLYGVRPDTGGTLRDISVTPLGDRALDFGVNPRLIYLLRRAIDTASDGWSVRYEDLEEARRWCRAVKIVATGGFTPEKIRRFEELGVPVDVYGVGSYLLSNSAVDGTNNDFTADVVRAHVDGAWMDIAKVGRRPCDNSLLEPVPHAEE